LSLGWPNVPHDVRIGLVIRDEGVGMVRIGALIVVVWLVIGAIAAGQRGYYNNANESCAKTSTTVVTIVAGPLNYIGVNPKVHCKLPQPST
jgi:hypothetical protein